MPSKWRCSIYFSNTISVFLEKINLIHHGLIRVSKSQGTNSREDSMEQHIKSLKYTSFSVSMTGPQISSFFTKCLNISVSLVAFKTSLWQSRHRTKKPFLLLHHLAIFPSWPCFEWMISNQFSIDFMTCSWPKNIIQSKRFPNMRINNKEKYVARLHMKMKQWNKKVLSS